MPTSVAIPAPPTRPIAIERNVLRSLERAFGSGFGTANPWHHLGALSFQMFWIVAATGIYLYALFDTSVTGAYRSVQAITLEQWYVGGVMRSLHRYASDALVVTMILHLAKELVQRHFGGFRWFSWLTGIALIWLTYAAGVGGYWLVWDELAQFSIIATAEWLDWLPLGADSIARNFLTEVDDRFFSLLIFLHIGIPLLLLLGMWIHIQRISGPRTFPPRSLALGTFATLVVVSLIKPVTSHAPADLAIVPAALALDWYYMFAHPLQYATSPGFLWALTGIATVVLAAMPALSRRGDVRVAAVSAANCNGCGRCFADCPYAAIHLDPHPSGRPNQRIAVVSADLCAACGICAGACPSSTPFRSVDALVTGIDMPDRRISDVRAELEHALAHCTAAAPIVIFGCARGARLDALRAADVVTIDTLCSGMLPPAFIEYAIRGGAAGVIVASCPVGECEFRTGADILCARFDGRREPHLRASVPREHVAIVWAGRGEETKLAAALDRLRTSVATHLPTPRGRLRIKRISRRV